MIWVDANRKEPDKKESRTLMGSALWISIGLEERVSGRCG